MSRGRSESSDTCNSAVTAAGRPEDDRWRGCKQLAAAVVGPLLIASALLSSVFYAGTSHLLLFGSHHQPSTVQGNAPDGGISAMYPEAAGVGMSAIGRDTSVGPRPAGRDNALVSSICKHTAFPHVCERELSGSRIDPKAARPLEVVRLAVRATARRVDEAVDLDAKCSRQAGLSVLEDQCAHDCVELLHAAKDQLNLVAARLSALQGNGAASDHLADVKVWLSSALSYQSACSDNFQVVPGSIQHQIQSNQAYLTQLLGVCLGLVDALSRLGSSLDSNSWLAALPFATHSRRRRLLHHHRLPSPDDSFRIAEGNDDGFPTWVSAAEHRLLQASPSAIRANAIVAKDGSGHYTTVSAAVNAIPSSFSGRYVIYIKKGVYKEVFNITSKQTNVTFVGDGIRKTIISGNRNVASGDYNTYRTSTVGVAASGFYARDLTIRNTAGPRGHQAVALRAGADHLVFYRCSFEGYQDTLYALSSRQFYRECQIYGTVDFIFGNAIAVFQNCALVARLPMKGQQNTYTAQGRQLEDDISGYSFHNCTVKAAASLLNASYTVQTFLGRPWKAYSRTVFMQSKLQAVVQAKGYLPWNASNPFTETVYYGEYGNRGAGAGTSQRVSWKGVHANMSKSDAALFTVAKFIGIQSWLSALQVPYHAKLI